MNCGPSAFPTGFLLSLGEEAARSLGLNLNRSRLLTILVVLLLAGTSTALAGPVAFVGLLVPHIVRRIAGGRYEAILPCSMMLGALMMVLADILSRTLNAPTETPVGLIFAVIGVPAFIWISRKEEETDA
ncbi:iron ABC transporter permease [Allobaculum sp. Allo2]|nr:iron ABC transporter permease [Allobaculum sp. Allo2]